MTAADKRVSPSTTEDADAFASWLASVANSELKPPVSGLECRFDDPAIEDSFVKFSWNTKKKAFKNGCVIMNVAFLLFLSVLSTSFDLMCYLLGQNLPVFLTAIIAFTSKPSDPTSAVKWKRQLTCFLFTFLNCMMATLSTSTSDLNAPVTTVIILIACHVTVSLSYYQKVVMFTVSVLYLCMCLMAAGAMGKNTDYTKVYSDGYCMDTTSCTDEVLRPRSTLASC